jgi:hypothetical protein
MRRNFQIFQDELDWSIVNGEDRAQRLVTHDQRFECCRKRGRIERTAYSHTGCDVVKGAVRLELSQKPQALLSIREWQSLIARNWFKGGLFISRFD